MTWIKLHRQIQDSEIWNGKEPFDRRSAWIDLLILASHNERRLIVMNQPVKLNRGDVVASKRFLMKRWKWGSSKTLVYLDFLIAQKMISKIRPHLGPASSAIYHITNYDIYQTRDVDGQTANQTSSRPLPDHFQTETKNYQKVKKGETDRRSSSSGSENIDRSNLSFASLSKKSISEKQKRRDGTETDGGPLARFRQKCESLGLNPFDEYQRTKGDITKIGLKDKRQ